MTYAATGVSPRAVCIHPIVLCRLLRPCSQPGVVDEHVSARGLIDKCVGSEIARRCPLSWVGAWGAHGD